MKKYIAILALLLCTVSSTVGAKSSSPSARYAENNGGIITPDVAIGGVRISGEYVSWFKNGQLAIKCATNGKEVLVTPQQYIPSGRTYAGFKIVTGNGTGTYYEFYWK